MADYNLSIIGLICAWGDIQIHVVLETIPLSYHFHCISCILFAMPSFEEKYYLTNPGLLRRIRRDLALFLDSFAFLLLWLTQGRKIRQAYRQAQLENTEILLEDILKKEQQ